MNRVVLTIVALLVAAGLAATTTHSAQQTPPRETVAGNSVTVANGAYGVLTFDSKVNGSDLLNLSDPANPRVVTAGVYAFTIVVGSTQQMTAGGRFFVDFSADPDGANASDLSFETDAADMAVTEPTAPPLTLVYYVPANTRIALIVYNADGSHPVGFALNEAIIQRVS